MEKEELTPEQAHYAAMEEFVCATHNIRFKETHENWRLMMEFLSERELPVNMRNLRFAYLTLSKDDLLDLQANQPQSSSNQPNLETRWHQKSKADSTLRCLSPDVGEVPKSKCRWIQELGRQRNSGFKKMARLQWVLALAS